MELLRGWALLPIYHLAGGFGNSFEDVIIPPKNSDEIYMHKKDICIYMYVHYCLCFFACDDLM